MRLTQVVHRVSLALLASAQAEIVKAAQSDDLGAVFEALKGLPGSIDPDAVMRAAFKINLKQRQVADLEGSFADRSLASARQGAGGGGGGGSAAAKDSGPRDSGAKAPGLKVREETKFADSEAPGHAPIGHAPGGAAVRENPLGPSSR